MKNSNFSVITFINGWTCWLYKDFSITLTEMLAEGFFDKNADLMNIGDIIICVAKDTTQQFYIKGVNPIKLEDMGK